MGMALRWDVFCRVIDNHGDLGVCWRLAVALAARGHAVRLWVDEPAALSWMAPDGAVGVTLQPWTDTPPDLDPGDVVVEAFGCDPPPAFVARMAAAAAPPVWINLEYLSAECYVERSHRLRSPQFSGPGAGLDKWFFYPGFSDATGGLMHADAPDAATLAALPAWLAARGWQARDGERSVLVFGYDNPALPGLLAAFADRPTLLRLAPGPSQRQVLALGRAGALPATVRTLALPHVPQPDFDRLLAASDLNLVRGEDSFVRAQVAAAAPMLWQIYPQHDGAHAAKLDAFCAAWGRDAPDDLARAVHRAQRALNGLAAWPDDLADLLAGERWQAWQQHQQRWHGHLRAGGELVDRLEDFVTERRHAPAGKPGISG